MLVWTKFFQLWHRRRKIQNVFFQNIFRKFLDSSVFRHGRLLRANYFFGMKVGIGAVVFACAVRRQNWLCVRLLTLSHALDAEITFCALLTLGAKLADGIWRRWQFIAQLTLSAWPCTIVVEIVWRVRDREIVAVQRWRGKWMMCALIAMFAAWQFHAEHIW